MKHTVHAPMPVRLAHRGMVTSVDQLASSVGVDVLRRGGSAADAAVATSAVLTVTAQHLCGLGGDLLAVVGRPGSPPVALVSAGHAGSGADADRLRAAGHAVMPRRGDVRVVTVPGCVDGWLALHARFGRLPLAEALAPAVAYAVDGFPASPLLAVRAADVADLPGAEPYRDLATGTTVRRPGVARTLEAIGTGGRDAFYGGEFGRGLVALGQGEFTDADLARPVAGWHDAVGLDVWGATAWTTPPPSQGYLTLLAAAIAARVGLPGGPDGPDDPRWAHVLVEACTQAGHDRHDALHEHASGTDLLSPARIDAGAAAVGARASGRGVPAAPGGTIHLNVVDGDGLAVSLTQSNAAGFGAHLVEPSTGIFLHNRGLGFSLVPGHPAEYGPGRLPPHTLSPALVTGPHGSPTAALGTMGADSQPQVLAQLLARLLHAGQPPEQAVAAARFVLAGPTGDTFATWHAGDAPRVKVEGHAPPAWAEGLAARGHDVVEVPPFDHVAGHAHAVTRTPRGAGPPLLRGAADPRVEVSAAHGL